MSSLHVGIKEALDGCSCYERIAYSLTYVLDLKVIAEFPVWAPVPLMSNSDILDLSGGSLISV